MKKIYLFLAVTLLAATISVSGQSVILRISNNYEVNIDGRYYGANETVPALSYGQHTVKLYEVKPGVLGIGKKRTLLSTRNFELRNNDVTIQVDQNGQLRIDEAGNYNTQTGNRDRNGNVNDGYDNERTGQKKNGKGYGPYNNPGRGHKYGLYKNKKGKKNNTNHDRGNEGDDRDDD